MKRFQTLKEIDLTSLCIDGKRLRLRSMHERYAEDILREFTEEIVRYMIPVPPKNIAEALAFISRTRDGMRDCRDLAFAILKSDTEEFLGVCGFHGHDTPETPELGIWIKKDAHGNGYGREAITMLVDWAIQNIGFDYLVYPVDRANFASRRIPESLGGAIFKERKAKRMNGEFLDEVVYRISRSVLMHNPEGSLTNRRWQ